MPKQPTFAQKHKLKNLMGGWSSGSNTNASMCAMEKQGWVKPIYKSSAAYGFHFDRWALTPSGRKIAKANPVS